MGSSTLASQFPRYLLQDSADYLSPGPNSGQSDPIEPPILISAC